MSIDAKLSVNNMVVNPWHEPKQPASKATVVEEKKTVLWSAIAKQNTASASQPIVAESIDLNDDQVEHLVQRANVKARAILGATAVERRSFVDKTLTRDAQIDAIRYSQAGIGMLSTDKVNLKQQILKFGWDRSKPRMTLIQMPDLELTSKDNRRLYALKSIMRESQSFFSTPGHQVQVRIYDHTYSKGVSGLVDSEKTHLIERWGSEALKELTSLEDLELKEGTYGAFIYYRMRNGEGLYNETPYGYTVDPDVRG